MHYAILASYAEGVVESWGEEEDKMRWTSCGRPMSAWWQRNISTPQHG
ncbi:MAG: hypothetical protein JJ911_08590 [Rhizobiaceae bacterium]|nr:hypothetical protein [Rhizobiaceae bacterium]